MPEPLKVKMTETMKVNDGGRIKEIRVSDLALKSTSAEQLANPPCFPTLKK
jgi:hypothetical protein